MQIQRLSGKNPESERRGFWGTLVVLMVQGLSSQLSELQIDISQPPEQLEIGLKYQYVPYLVQFYTYFFIIH